MLYVWGKVTAGQLGLGSGCEEPNVNRPRPLPSTSFQDSDVKPFGTADEDVAVQICAGEEHTIVLASNGRVFTCGTNDYSQLARQEKLSRLVAVSSLLPYTIRAVSCGEYHCLALDEWGKVFSWGSERFGQCGHNQGAAVQENPRQIRALGTENVAQISCGLNHCLVMTKGGQLYTWGDNSYGQLGLGDKAERQYATPQLLEDIQGLPVRQIACGGNHSFVITVSGAVLAWGRNNRGQLGTGDTNDQRSPRVVRSLRKQDVVYMACGLEHSVTLTKDGGVFSFGAGSYGQLGHGSKNDEHLPRKIIELMGTQVTQIACGKFHTLAFVPSRGRLYSFGLGGAGQLGTISNDSSVSPQIVRGPWVSPTGETAQSEKLLSSEISEPVVVAVIGAGGDCSFASVCNPPSQIFDQRQPSEFSQIQRLNDTIIDQMCSFGEDDVVDQDFLELLETVFQSPACLNASFLSESHQCCSAQNLGLDMAAWKTTTQKLRKCEHGTIRDLISSGIVKFLLPRVISTRDIPELLRIFVILPMFNIFEDSSFVDDLHAVFSKKLISLEGKAWAIVEQWYSERPAEYLRPYVQNFKAAVVETLKTGGGFKDQTSELILITLRILNRINVSNKCIIGYEDFYIPEINELIILERDYELWQAAKFIPMEQKFFVCNYPFIFDSQAKTRLLQYDQASQMREAATAAASQAAIQAFFIPQGGFNPIVQFLYLEVDRNNLVEDTLIQIRQFDTSDLKKPLKVKFKNEDAEDAGGVKKEFFLLVLREILDPKFGMFKPYEETQTLWFQNGCFEEILNFVLIGILCGLAIYNFTIIYVPFPLVLYKKLLGEDSDQPVGLDDLEGLSPSLAKGLKDLLDYQDPDVEEVFCLNFTITEEFFGDTRVVDLKENGSNVPVNQENKSEYVQLYCDYILNKSIESQYNAFKKGFQLVCVGRVLELFHARELMALISGTENFNWEELEETVEYKEGYDKDHPTIKFFWSVFYEMSDQDKKKFLRFLTGTDRVPIFGLKSLNIVIQKANDVKFLPVAHTCSNTLDLPCYSTRERLKYKLLYAIQFSEGFGLV